MNFLCRSIQPVSRARTFARSSIMCFREHSTCDRLVRALLLLEMISEMLFLISSQMELLFASSLLKLVRMGVKMSGRRMPSHQSLLSACLVGGGERISRELFEPRQRRIGS